MISALTGTLLATSAGMNAYIPLLGIALLSRFTPLMELPEQWTWISSNWALIVLGVLLVVEVLVDKFPALDSINDVLQSVVRPASGGMVFSAGVGSQTLATGDIAPEQLAAQDWGQVWPMVTGIVIALVPHVTKAVVRPLLNSLTGGTAAPVMSFTEDFSAIGLLVFAIVAPIVGLVLLAGLVWATIVLLRRTRRTRRERRDARLAARAQPATGPADGVAPL